MQRGVNMAVKETFATRLRGLREACGLTQAELADELKISRGSLSFYENAERTPDIEILDKVTFLFGVPTDYLLGYVDTTHEENQDVNLFLGLSDKAIQNIKEDVVDQEVLSMLIENDLFCHITRDIYKIVKRDDEFGEILENIEQLDLTEDMSRKFTSFFSMDSLHSATGYDYLKYKTFSSFEKVLDSTIKRLKEKRIQNYTDDELKQLFDTMEEKLKKLSYYDNEWKKIKEREEKIKQQTEKEWKEFLKSDSVESKIHRARMNGKY